MYEYTFLSIKFTNRRYKEYRVKDVCIRVSVDGKDYVIFMLAACYGNKWYLVQFYNAVSSLLGMNSISGGIGEYDLFVQ